MSEPFTDGGGAEGVRGRPAGLSSDGWYSFMRSLALV